MTYEETKLSVIIVNYNVKYFLEQCLYSVRAAVTGMDAEVFVVDNNSTDGSVEYLRPKFPEVVFIENKDNPGFAKANNQAIRQCTGEYVLLLNPDTVVGEESLRSLCFQMDEDPEIGAEWARGILAGEQTGFPFALGVVLQDIRPFKAVS